MDDQGIENAAILLMSLGEEHASEVFKHLAPKEVQRMGETIARMKSISHDRLDQVLDKFRAVAGDQSMLVSDNDEYVRSVLKRALGDDKANLLLDRILQGRRRFSGIESLKWMDPSSIAELMRTSTRRSSRRSWFTWKATMRPRC
jgi:flagellar motor switch protein FliG